MDHVMESKARPVRYDVTVDFCPSSSIDSNSHSDASSEKMHRMHSSASISERKFAEKLTILLERGQGILTRVYNIKKVSLRLRLELGRHQDRC